MRFLDEYRRRPAAMADHLPWAALVAPGVILNKDGSFLTGFRFRGPDLESSTEDELMAVRARLNNALRRLGSGWCLHVEARRRAAAPYPESEFDIDAAWLLDAERRRLAAYAEVEAQTNPLSAAGAAIGIVAFHDLTPTALESESGTLTMTLPYSAVSLADTLIADFEGSGYFYDIRPRTDAQNQRLVIEMKIREAAPPPVSYTHLRAHET